MRDNVVSFICNFVLLLIFFIYLLPTDPAQTIHLPLETVKETP